MSRELYQFEYSVPERLLIKQFPELKGERLREVFDEARSQKLETSLNNGDVSKIPLYSHDATYQSVFTKGWLSLSDRDLRLFLATQGVNRATS